MSKLTIAQIQSIINDKSRELGRVIVTDSTGANALDIDVTGAAKITGTITGAITGSVTANAGTNLNTSALALETGGNLDAIAPPTTITEYQVTLTNTTTEYSQAFPAGTKAFEFWNRNANGFYWAFTTGKAYPLNNPHKTMPATGSYSKENVLLTGVTLYLAAMVAGDVIEINCYT